jgi:hypothetical protein
MPLSESDAGQTVICLSCATPFRAPAPAADVVEAAAGADNPLAGLLDTGTMREPAKFEPVSVPRPEEPIRVSPRVIGYLFAGAALLVLLVGGMVYWITRPEPPARVAKNVDAGESDDSGDLVDIAKSAAIAATAPATSPTRVVATSTPATTTTSAVPKRPPLQPLPDDPSVITDERIGQSIQKGVDSLIKVFDPQTHVVPDAGAGASDQGYACGLDALCVYALLQSGQAIQDKRLDIHGAYMKSMIDAMKRLPADTGKATYARGIRATALALYDRPEDRTMLTLDVTYLVSSHFDGAYDYARPADGILRHWDNSNSQYGLLGVWSAAETGMRVSSDYWTAVQKHWASKQHVEGTWSYQEAGAGSLSMTSAGTASLFVTEDYLYADRFADNVGRDPFTPPLEKAMRWWDNVARIDLADPQSGWWGYTLYGVERVGLASGFKYFGKHDWYRELARQVVARQGIDGSWGNTIDTAYALLFLSRGRHPILMNKLRFEHSGKQGELPGAWANRPRDAANLARFASRQLERPLNWQVVTLDRDWTEWLDSPVLSLASHVPPFLSDEERGKLKQYVEAGGLLFLHADSGSRDFDKFATDLAATLFPQSPMVDVPADHPVYNVLYKVNPRPPLKMVTNGVRALVLYSPTDISRYWQLRAEKQGDNVFRFGVNLFVYAAGKREFRNRLSSPYVALPIVWPPPLGTIDVARVKYDGAWDPEPGAWRRYANWFAKRTGIGLNVREVELKQLQRDSAPVAVLTGTAQYKMTPADVDSLKRYVQDGGVVLVDRCGGVGASSAQFVESIRAGLARAFPGEKLERIPESYPLLNPGAPGMSDVRKPKMRRFVAEQTSTTAPSASLEILRSEGGAVILSSVDVTSGLLGTQTWGINGYEPEYAESLVENLIFWTVDGQEEGSGL